MSVGTEIVALFEAESLGTSGSDLFLNRMPENPSACGAVYETGGTGPQGGFSTPGILHERPGIQVRFRGNKHDADSPYAKIQSAYRVLMENWGQVLSGVQYLTIQPSQAPFILERDGSGRVVWAFNALVEKELS